VLLIVCEPNHPVKKVTTNLVLTDTIPSPP
jgi:hypothetical protein